LCAAPVSVSDERRPEGAPEAVAASWTIAREEAACVPHLSVCRMSDLDLRSRGYGPACAGRASKAEPGADAGPRCRREAALILGTAQFGSVSCSRPQSRSRLALIVGHGSACQA
jgi:hypothetical protein